MIIRLQETPRWRSYNIFRLWSSIRTNNFQVYWIYGILEKPSFCGACLKSSQILRSIFKHKTLECRPLMAWEDFLRRFSSTLLPKFVLISVCFLSGAFWKSTYILWGIYLYLIAVFERILYLQNSLKNCNEIVCSFWC